MLELLLGIVAGSITPVQTAVNSRLGRTIGSPLRASMVSFAVGLASLLIVVLALGPHPLFPATVANGSWWMWLAGLFGVVFLTGNVLLLPRLGSLKTVMLPVAGQIAMGLMIDVFGWFGTQRQSISLTHVFGTILALIGFLIAVAAANLRFGRHNDSAHCRAAAPSSNAVCAALSQTWLWSIAGVGFGMCAAIQTALLGKLGVELGSPVKASLASFAVGLAALLVVVGLFDRTYDLSGAFRQGNPWWMWLGGLMGGTLVICNSYCSVRIGTSLTVMLVLLGQISGGLLVDQFGMLGVPRKRVLPIQYIGVVLAAAGIVLKSC